jgi:hypothetical protein
MVGCLAAAILWFKHCDNPKYWQDSTELDVFFMPLIWPLSLPILYFLEAEECAS